VLCDLDARWRLLERFEDYRQVLVLGALPIEELGEPGLVRDLAREVNDELAELVRSHPDRFAAFAASLPLYRRFYADTAMFGALHGVRSAFEFFGPDRMLFGTDMPLGGPAIVPDTIADIEALGLPPGDREKVFAGNAHASRARHVTCVETGQRLRRADVSGRTGTALIGLSAA